MNRKDQIKSALELLRPTDRAGCVKYLNQALDDLAKIKDENQHIRDLTSKDARKALTAYRRVLLRAQVAHKRLPDGLKQTLGLLGGIDGRQEVNFEALIKYCDGLLIGPRPRSTRDYVKYNAAAWARNLLNLLDIESPLTHDGKWPALAAILHGDASSDDLFHHCSEYNDASRNSGPK
jgi:hypothetical protein